MEYLAGSGPGHLVPGNEFDGLRFLERCQLPGTVGDYLLLIYSLVPLRNYHGRYRITPYLVGEADDRRIEDFLVGAYHRLYL